MMDLGKIPAALGVVGGAMVVGGALGAIGSLSHEKTASASGLPSMEKRETLKNVLIGMLGGGAAAGVFMLARTQIPALTRVPLTGSVPMLLGVSMATGAAGYGAYTLGRNVAN
jgi:hypothetical protein